MSSFASTIDRFATGTYQVKRRAPGATVDGRDRKGAETVVSIRASVQPASGSTLDRLPEGMRQREVREVYSATQLRTQGPGRLPDLIVIDGNDYEVESVDDWSQLAGYWKAIVTIQH